MANDLQYKIDRGALVGENKVVLTKLQLGERVESAALLLALAAKSDGHAVLILDRECGE